MAVAVPLYTSEFQTTSYYRVYPPPKWSLANDAGDLQLKDVPKGMPWRYAEWACMSAPTRSAIDQDLLTAAVDIEESRMRGNGRIPSRKWSAIKAIDERFFGKEWKHTFEDTGIDQAHSEDGWRRVQTTVDRTQARGELQSVIVELDSLSSTMDSIQQAYFPTPLTHFRGPSYEPVQLRTGEVTRAAMHYQESLVVGVRNTFAPSHMNSREIREHLKESRASLLVDRTTVADWLLSMAPEQQSTDILRSVPPLVGDAINDLFLTQVEQDRLYHEFFEDTANRILTRLMRSSITPDHIKSHIVTQGCIEGAAFDVLLQVRPMLEADPRLDEHFLQRLIQIFYTDNTPVIDAFFCTIMPMPDDFKASISPDHLSHPLNLLLRLILHSETAEEARSVFDGFVDPDIHMSAANIGMVRARLTFMNMTRITSGDRHNLRQRTADKASVTMRLLAAMSSIVSRGEGEGEGEGEDWEDDHAFVSLVNDVSGTMRDLIQEVAEDEGDNADSSDMRLLIDALIYPTRSNYHFLEEHYLEWLLDTDALTALVVRHFERIYAPALRGHFLREDAMNTSDLMANNEQEWVNLLTEELIQQVERGGAGEARSSPLEEWRRHTVAEYLQVANQAQTKVELRIRKDASHVFTYYPLLGNDNLEEQAQNLALQTAGSLHILEYWLLDQIQPYRVLSESLAANSYNDFRQDKSSWSESHYSQAVVKTFSITSRPAWKWISTKHQKDGGGDQADTVIKVDVDLIYTLAKASMRGDEGRVASTILNSINQQRVIFSRALLKAVLDSIQAALVKPSQDRALIVITGRSLPRKGQRHSRRYVQEMNSVEDYDDVGEEGTYQAYTEEDEENPHFANWIAEKLTLIDGYRVLERFTTVHRTDRPPTRMISVMYTPPKARKKSKTRSKKKKKSKKSKPTSDSGADMQWASTAPPQELVRAPSFTATVPTDGGTVASLCMFLAEDGEDTHMDTSSSNTSSGEEEEEEDEEEDVYSHQADYPMEPSLVDEENDLLTMNLSSLKDVVHTLEEGWDEEPNSILNV